MKLKKVMIVEDNLLLSIVEERMVTKLGYEVVGKAMSGEEALRKLDEYDPEILIMDIQLEGSMNGIETVEKIRERNHDLPVIFLSGNSDAAHKKKAEDLHCVDFLVKPITASVLVGPLEKASRQKESTHAA